MAFPVDSGIIEQDTLEGPVIEFSIGQPKWVMRALADLYSDITTAVIREYSTNAFDAELALAGPNGTPKPIEVTLPSVLEPVFKVKDNGIGMSTETLKYQYTAFGESGSRQSEHANGMLGFGCKAGAAYTNSFTVTSVKDGTKTVVVIDRRPDWSITMRVLAIAKTDEANGTEIVIPVHNVHEFVKKANDFYKFWLPGRVLVNGVAPDHRVGDKITDNFYHAVGYEEARVVMGNVPYRVTNYQALFAGTGMNAVPFVAYLDNGEVEFSNSREDLKYTPTTVKTLNNLIKDFTTDILAKAQADIAKASNHADAYARWNTWRGVLGTSALSKLFYKGDMMVNHFNINGMRYNMKASRYTTHRITEWTVDMVPRTVFVTGFTSSLSSSHKSRAASWLVKKNLSATYIVFTAADKVDSVWVPAERIVTWEQVKADIPPPARNSYSGRGGRVKGSWDFHTAGGMQSEQPVPKDKTIYWASINECKRWPIYDLIVQFDSDAIVLRMPKNRLDKFQRENPNVKNFLTAIKESVVKDAGSLLSDDAKLAKSLSSNTIQLMGVLDCSKIDDPVFTKFANLIKRRQELFKAYNTNKNLAVRLGVGYNDYTATTNKFIDEHYALLNAFSPYQLNSKVLDELYTYINNKYADRKKK